MKFRTLAVLILSAALAVAADIKLPILKTDAETFTNVTVTSVSATDIYFIHSRGVGNAKLKNLDPELQKKFHFDPSKAAAKAAQQADANARYTQEANAKAAASAPAPEPAHEEPAPDDIPVHEINADSFLNQPAPKIVVQKWLSNEPNIEGKFVIVDFWATWCGPCRKTIPTLNELAAKYKDRLLVMGISDEPEQIVRKMTDPKIEYYVGIDTNHESLTAINIRGIPHALLIDPKGIVRFEGHPSLLDGPRLEKLLAKYGD